MKVIFLDIDGVLNTPPLAALREDAALCPERVARLEELCARTGAVLVLSSTWRRLYGLSDIRGWLVEKGLSRGRLIDRTPVLPGRYRGEEIAAWLESVGPRVKTFVILDDDADMADLGDRLVQTTTQDGLQDAHVERAAELLGAVSREIA